MTVSRFNPFDIALGQTQDLFAWLFIAFFVVLGAISVKYQGMTNDESMHYRYGQQILQSNSTRFDDSKMPVSALNALPAWFAQFLPQGGVRNFLEGYYLARLMTLFFSALVAYLVFSWSRTLYGFVPAIFSLILYVFDPNIIAHSQLITTDAYAFGIIAFAFYWLWRFANQRSLKNGIACALALGLSQIAKYTSIVLFPLFFICLAAYDIFQAWLNQNRLSDFVRKYPLRYLVYIFIGIPTSLLIINIAFLFNNTFMLLGDYKFKSGPLEVLQIRLSRLGGVPVPVPYPYVEGLDKVIHRERTSTGFAANYLLGQIRKEGFPGYFFVASLLKTPIASQLIILGAMIVYITDKDRRRRFFLDEIFLLTPVVFYVIYFNFFYNAQTGIRYYLVIFPLLFVFVGSLFRRWGDLSATKRNLSISLLVYLVISVLSYYPNYLTYFNEIVWDRKSAYEYLADSNIDWKQGSLAFEQYMKDHPDAVYAPETIQSGTIVINVNKLVGLDDGPDKYAWLRNNFKPTGTIANSYLIYEISPQQVNVLCETTDYCRK